MRVQISCHNKKKRETELFRTTTTKLVIYQQARIQEFVSKRLKIFF